MNKKEVCYDIETLSNCFTYTDINIQTKEISQFVIHKDRNELKELVQHLKSITLGIGYNNISFDYPVIHYILENYLNWLQWNKDNEEFNGESIANLIYQEAQRIINIQNPWESGIVFWKWKIQQIDLFKIMHYDNLNKLTNLKWIEFSLDMNTIQDMPIKHTDLITELQIQEVLDYNLNDVQATLELYLVIIGQTDHPLYKGINKLQLREDLRKEYNAKIHWLNFNDVKIGDQINKQTYAKLKGLDTNFKIKNTQRDTIKVQDCLSNEINFEIQEFKDFYDKFTQIQFSPKALPKSEYSIQYKYLSISFGFGGLHTVDSKRNIILKQDETLIDADCTSMYPMSIINLNIYPEHLDKEWLEGYKWIFNKRVQAKKDGLKSINEAYKLALNGGGYGKLNEPNSWQYDPLQAFRVTIYNQFMLLKICEMFLQKGIFVVSLNTDGILCIVKDNQKEDYNSICTEWMKLSLHTLEYTKYKRFIQTSVNDYLALTIENKFKYKGDFEIDKELHKNKSNTIRAIALKEYYINNTLPFDTISNHKSIFDFCIGRKKNRNQFYKFYYAEGFDLKEDTLDDKVIRYYVSTNGGKLEKIQGKKITKLEQDYFITLYMKHEIKDMQDYHIDLQFYEKEVIKITNSIKTFDLDTFLSEFKSFKQLQLF